jgi:hypothetical protein
MNKPVSIFWKNDAMKKLCQMIEAKIQPVWKARKMALAIWQNTPMKQWQKPKLRLCNGLLKAGSTI